MSLSAVSELSEAPAFPHLDFFLQGRDAIEDPPAADAKWRLVKSTEELVHETPAPWRLDGPAVVERWRDGVDRVQEEKEGLEMSGQRASHHAKGTPMMPGSTWLSLLAGGNVGRHSRGPIFLYSARTSLDSSFFWLVMVACAVLTVVVAEQLCVRREMREGLAVISGSDSHGEEVGGEVEMGRLLRRD